MGSPVLYYFTFEELRTVIPLSAIGPWTDVTLHLTQPWPLFLTVGTTALYAVLALLVWPAMYARTATNAAERSSAGKPGPPEPAFAFPHHAALCVYSGITWVATAYHIVTAGEYASFSAFACTPLPPLLRLLSLSFTLSKVWEWGDTLVHYARGQTPAQIGFLHLYHHATTTFLFFLTPNFPSTDKCGMLLNGFVHFLMYGHYAWRLPRWARPLITAAQIAQLVGVTWVWSVTPSTCPTHAAFPAEHAWEFAAPYAMVPVYTLAFLHFFVVTYAGAGGKGRAGQGSQGKQGKAA